MVRWQWKTFSELTVEELYDVLALRSRVFVVEQRSIYLDPDGLDHPSHHLLGWDTARSRPTLVAYLRVLPPGLKFPEASLGRVVVAPEARGQGLAAPLTAQALDFLDARYPGVATRISAQHYLQAFYERRGFHAEGGVYDEDGIPHIEMRRRAR
ncbi:GNAT family N-acetyltransferase [Corallococcus sp. H22C18031201]|nr:GNAT family N-acetyltransferase [Corallococcus sp. H22C18031201]